jgi:hypothetical protein
MGVDGCDVELVLAIGDIDMQALQHVDAEKDFRRIVGLLRLTVRDERQVRIVDRDALSVCRRWRDVHHVLAI